MSTYRILGYISVVSKSAFNVASFAKVLYTLSVHAISHSYIVKKNVYMGIGMF